MTSLIQTTIPSALASLRFAPDPFHISLFAVNPFTG